MTHNETDPNDDISLWTQNASTFTTLPSQRTQEPTQDDIILPTTFTMMAPNNMMSAQAKQMTKAINLMDQCVETLTFLANSSVAEQALVHASGMQKPNEMFWMRWH